MNDKDEKPIDPRAAHQARVVQAKVRQVTGKQYPHLEAQLTNLTAEAILELGRLISDLEFQAIRAKRQAIHEPWRR